MKKLLSLCLSLFLLAACLPLTAVATEKVDASNVFAPETEGAESIEDAVLAALGEQDSSLYVTNGLLYNYRAYDFTYIQDLGESAHGVLALGEGKALTLKSLIGVIDYTSDVMGMQDYSYDFTITGRFSLPGTKAGTLLSLGELKIEAGIAPFSSLKVGFGTDISTAMPSFTAIEANQVFDLALSARLTPSFADDGALSGCRKIVNYLALNNSRVGLADGFLLECTQPTITSKDVVLGGDADLNVFSFQFYNRELSALDIKQNNFADIVYYHGIDALPISYLTDEAREAYMTPLLTAEDPYTLTADEAKALVAQGKEALDAIGQSYDYSKYILEDKVGDSVWYETHNALMALAAENGLDLSAYFKLPVSLAEDLIYEIEDLINDKSLTNDTLSTTITEMIAPYSEMMASAITFDGYQAKLEGESAIRARFSVDNAKIKALEDLGLTVTYGITKTSLDAQSFEVVYGEDATAVHIYQSEATNRFAVSTVLPEGADAADYNRSYKFGAFITVESGDDIYTLVFDCAGDLGTIATVKGICSYFAQNGYESAPAIIRASTIS